MNENVIIGSAKRDENGKYSGGRKGDQDGIEVSTQKFYVHNKGWVVLRAKDIKVRKALAERMLRACLNNNIGYSQSDRASIIKDGINTVRPTNADCSSLVRECVKEASGKDPGNFTTINEVAVLSKTGFFMPSFNYTGKEVLFAGDILVTKTKGHTVIVTSSPYSETSVMPIKIIDSAPTVIVKLNSRGSAVKWIQLHLNQKGYNLEVDGIAGNKTITAIKDFQKRSGLTVDGIAGNKTYGALLK